MFLVLIKKEKCTCDRISFLIKLQACNFILKKTLAKVFSCEFSEMSKNTFSYRTRCFWFFEICFGYSISLVSIKLKDPSAFCPFLSKLKSKYWKNEIYGDGTVIDLEIFYSFFIIWFCVTFSKFLISTEE